MGKKPVIFLIFLLSVSVMARPLTTKQMRDNTIRINAMEVEKVEIEREEIIIEVPDKVILDEKKLLFDFDDSRVKEQYYGELHNIVRLVRESNTYILITGYTDSKGTDEYNDKLSYRRAESVKAKLLEFGLTEEDIQEIKGMGKRNPVAPNTKPDGKDNPEGRTQNRRIEIDFVRR